MTTTTLPRPGNTDSSLWLDEDIWGHRLHDEQSPWLAYLEFLNVLAYEESQGRAFTEPDGLNRLLYRPAKRLYLRNILFNNPRLEDIRARHPSDDGRWQEWLKQMESTQSVRGLPQPKFDYLRSHFHSFEDFCEVVHLIRSTSLEMSSNKRWTSKFVFPYGVDCLYEDLDNDGVTNDRRFFGRSGELLYLMLTRSAGKQKLLEQLRSRYLRADSIWNRLVRAMQPAQGDPAPVDRANAYLPYSADPNFDDLAADWTAVLGLNIPDYDAVPHLVNLAGLHIVKYQLSRALLQVGEKSRITMVCEVVAPHRSLVREVSCSQYESNNLLPAQAVVAVIDAFEATTDWQQAMSGAGAFVRCKALLLERFTWGEDYDGPNDPAALLKDFRTAAIRRHRQHVANIHRNYGREIGLVSRRGTVKLRYAPNDALLATLLLANVPVRVELHQFLSQLFERYGFIFGDREAESALNTDEFDKKAFQANARRLEERLTSLGFLRRLSDGCAYVENPYKVQQ